MACRPKTVDDVIRFILANAPAEGVELKRNPFRGRKFDYELVDGAIRGLHAQGRFLDLEAYDIKGTNNMWNTGEGRNDELARKATKQLVKKLQEEQPDKKLEEILPTINDETFHKKPINRYQTALGAMLAVIYNGSPYAALNDLIDSHPKFTEYRDLQPYDMLMSPLNTWKGEEGIKLARQATKQLIKRLQEEQPDKKLEEILPMVGSEAFWKKPINRYQTTLGGMIQRVPSYNVSPYTALKDLIDNDQELAEYRDLQPYDMQMAPQKTWRGENGRKLARQATKQLIKKLQEEQPGKRLEEILPTITQDTFYTKPINKYQTTLGGMIQKVPGYKSSPYQALKDLAENDPEFTELLPVIETMTHRAA